jgi:hypothetical protein
VSDLEDGYDKRPATRSGSETAWVVEARSTRSPRQVNNQIFDGEWRRVKFDQHPMGVPATARGSRYTAEAQMLSYPAAQALRWWIHAVLESDYNNLCFETRLVKHVIKYSVSNAPESQHAVIGGEDRSGVMPVTPNADYALHAKG